MKRKYPFKCFLIFTLTDFFIHFFFLFIPGLVLCFIGIWVKVCLWIGMVLLVIDLIASVIDQLILRKVAVTPSDHPGFNEKMDEIYGPPVEKRVFQSVCKKR